MNFNEKAIFPFFLLPPTFNLWDNRALGYLGKVIYVI